ncbi:hypothetical protein FRC17_003788, partial [Serendipita sp. 399]
MANLSFQRSPESLALMSSRHTGGNYQSAWTAFKNGLNVHFAPALFIDIANFKSLSWLDGAFSWNGGWAIQLNDQSSTTDIQQA